MNVHKVVAVFLVGLCLGVVARALFGCSDASFDVAALEAKPDSESEAIADADAQDSHDAQDGKDEGAVEGGSADTDSTASESAIDTSEVLESGDAPDVRADGSEASADAPPDADGCTLYPHDDPMSTSYESCLPTGVPTDASTYSPALFAAEIAHAEAHTPWITWGTPSSITCAGVSCALYSLTVDAGVAYGTWCSSGAIAGWFIETGTGGVPMCPTDLVHGEWR